MPKFEANMNYIPPSPPSFMKQCNKSATVKFHMELLMKNFAFELRFFYLQGWIRLFRLGKMSLRQIRAYYDPEAISQWCDTIRGGNQSTPPGDKAWRIIAPIERYSGYGIFNEKRKSCNRRCPDSVYFHTLLLIIYLSAIERLICRREMSLIGSTSFGFAQNTMHDFQNTVLNA